MSRSQKLLSFLEKFNVDNPEDEIVQIDNEYRRSLEEICDELLNIEIVYSSMPEDSRINHILIHSSSIMTRFLNADNAEPLDVMNFTVLMKLCRLTSKFKTLLLSELIDDFSMLKKNHDLVIFKFEKEQQICDTYKSRLKNFKTNSNESEIYMINEYFTYFLFEYLRMLSNFKNEHVVLEKNIKLLLEVADDEMLAKNFHVISDLLPQTSKLLILQKITNCITKPKFDLENCEFLKSKNKDYKSEMCAMTFFILQNICKRLEKENLCQSSHILSKFNIESIISLIDSPLDLVFEKTYEKSTTCIAFKKYKNIIEMPLEKIDKCLKVLELLSISLRGHKKQIHNSPFALILISIFFEFVVATEFNNSVIMKLIKIIIDFLKICRLPKHFLPVSFALDIYQKFKSDDKLKLESIQLFKSISNRLNKDTLQKTILNDLEKCINVDQNWVDKAIIISCFLGDIPETHLTTNTSLIEFHYTLNEFIILSSNISPENHLLVYPYAVSLNFSIVNKNEDCLFNNLAILDDYITILFNEDVKVRLEDKKFLLNIICKHYEMVAHCLPKEILLQCWKYVLNPINMDDKVSKVLLELCSSNDLIKIIDVLKVETMKIIEGNESSINQDYYDYIHELWSFLLNTPFYNQKKKIRKENINHFCFFLNRTYLFNTKKIQTEQSLILLLKLVCSLLQIPWINKTTIMNCSLRIMTFVEKSTSNSAQLLIEASELLIVLYKCPNNSIKPYLGLYTTAFANILRKCVLAVSLMEASLDNSYYIPFHKLEKCSSLFKQNKSDFDIICRYIIEDFIDLVKNNHNNLITTHFLNIVFNFMDICPSEEMKKLMLIIQGPSLLLLRNAYSEYRSNVRFTGRL